MIILIPAVGKGSRFVGTKYKLPKPNIEVDGLPMLVRSAKSLGFKGTYIFLVREGEHREKLVESIRSEFPKAKIGVVSQDTEGAAATALVAEDFINTEEELVIANCDQIMEWGPWNTDIALRQLRKYDAGLVTVNSSDPKHSYALMQDNHVTQVVEKEVVSDVALTGIHYWKSGKYFVESANEMIQNGRRASNGEYYIGPTYNELIKTGKKVGCHMISNDAIHFVGTPDDLERYESRQNK
jgi:dTDP-glucose pyrophosphorylase